jgi:hypothetical protein
VYGRHSGADPGWGGSADVGRGAIVAVILGVTGLLWSKRLPYGHMLT